METGEKIYGFEVKEKKYVREVEGDIIQMEHLSTGAQVVVIDNQDVKKSFLVGFRTIPKDSTGVFHILEHSVLNGSRRYPDKAMFVNLMKHSMAEFVNAITYPDHTVYPLPWLLLLFRQGFRWEEPPAWELQEIIFGEFGLQLSSLA